jgi:hypothetical protein
MTRLALSFISTFRDRAKIRKRKRKRKKPKRLVRAKKCKEVMMMMTKRKFNTSLVLKSVDNLFSAVWT